MSELAEKLDALLAKYYNGVHFDTIEPLAPLLAAVARDAAAYRSAEVAYVTTAEVDDEEYNADAVREANLDMAKAALSLDVSLAALAKEIG